MTISFLKSKNRQHKGPSATKGKFTHTLNSIWNQQCMQRWNSLLLASRAAKFCGGETEVSSSKLCFSQEGRGSVTKTFMSHHFIFKPIWRMWQGQWLCGVPIFSLTSWENQTDSVLVNENKITREATPISKVTIDEWCYRRLSCPLASLVSQSVCL